MGVRGIPVSRRRDMDGGMRLIVPIALALFSTSCVVRQYGGTAPSSTTAAAESLQPVDFSGVEKDLEKLISTETENVDRRDRLEAAWELCQRVKTQRPSAQHAVHRYLVRLVEIERRAADAATEALANARRLHQLLVLVALEGREEVGHRGRDEGRPARGGGVGLGLGLRAWV